MKRIINCLLTVGITLLPFLANAFSVLTHEALIDANWDKVILPTLRQKYPLSTTEELKNARAYAYGGAVSPDMGYYPFGSPLFTNLVHYVRSGDFIESLFDMEKNVNEYAFALGALCHYMADKYGHPLGTNKSVPIVYPATRKKFGNIVTYEQDKVSHLRMEFGFDVLQTARGNYATQNYHNYIGFSVADTLLSAAFLKTYGLDIKQVFPNFSLALGTFRWTVKSLFPRITKAAWVTKKSDIRKTQPGVTSRKFVYRMHRKKYQKEFGKHREKPGFFANILSFMIRILPKVGPLKALKFKTPGPEAEKIFIQSFDTVSTHYMFFLKDKNPKMYQLEDIDFDTGNKTKYGEYTLADETYKNLLLKLKSKNFDHVTPQLRQNIINFYTSHESQLAASDPKGWKEIHEALMALKEDVK